MGQILERQENISQKLEKYKTLETVKDSRYGEVQLMLDQSSNTKLAVKELLIQSQEELEVEVKQLKQKKEQKHKNCLNIIDFVVQSEDRFCSSINRLIWLIEYIPRDLSVIIRSKRLQSVPFTENQITNVLNQIIDGLLFFQAHNITHGDLRSNSIFISLENEQNLEIKIVDPLIIKQVPQFVYCMTQHPKRGMYLSPQLLKALYQKNWQPVYDSYKSDIFSLGIVILEISNLQYCDNIYDFQRGVLLEDVLEDYLKTFNEKYSQKLYQIVKQMLSIEESERSNLEQIKNLLLNQENEQEKHILTDQTNKKQYTGQEYKTIQQQNIQKQQQISQQDLKQSKSKIEESSKNLSNEQEQKIPLKSQPKSQKKQGISLIDNNDHNSQPLVKQQELNNHINNIKNSYVDAQIQFKKNINSLTQNNNNQQTQNLMQQQSPLNFKNKENIMTPNEKVGQNIILHNQISQIGIKDSYSPITHEKQDNVYQTQNIITNNNRDSYTAVAAQQNNTLNLSNYQIIGEQEYPGPNEQKSNSKLNQNLNQQMSSQSKYSNIQNDYQIPPNIQNIIDEFKGINYRNQQYQQVQENHQYQIQNQQLLSSQKQIQQEQLNQQTESLQYPEAEQTDQNYSESQEAQIQDQLLLQQEREINNQQIRYHNPATFYQYIEDIDIDMNNFAPVEDLNQLEKIQETYEDGSIYDGEKYNGRRHGHGKFYYADGGYYEGEWKDGRMEGLGTLYYPSGGLAYLGQWKEDKFNGKGTVYNEIPNYFDTAFDFENFDNLGEFWLKYEGDFLDDNKDGIGSLYLSNGDKFTGYFSNDLVHGQGTYFQAKGEVINGCWNQNRLEYTFQN